MVDPKQAFIPLLSNTLISASGWPDMQLGTFTSQQGVYREEWSILDDTSMINNAFDITCNFRNIQGDPVSVLFTTWLHYMAGVYEGTMLPYPDSIWEQEKDYECAFYRLVLSPDFDYVNKIARTIMFPTSAPTGAIFNYETDKPRAADLDQITVQFRAQGAEYNDPILIDEFNELVAEFNPAMGNLKLTSDGYKDPSGALLRIAKADRKYLNFYGYPHIDPATGKIDWFIATDVYNQLSGAATLSTTKPASK